MNPNRRPRDTSPNQNQNKPQEQDISSIWSSLGRLRAELRRMEHRLDGAGETGAGLGGSISSGIPGGQHHQHLPPSRFSTAASASGGTMPGVSSSSEQSSETAKHSGSRSQHLSGARRKVSRIGDKHPDDGTSQHARRSGHRVELSSRSDSRSVNHENHGFREDSPKRVDFSKAHQLREVNWDGTYQDSLAYPSDLASSTTTINSTVTNSRDIRETDLRFLNFSRVPSSSGAAAPLVCGISTNNNAFSTSSPPFAPPPSTSNSATNHHLILPPQSSSASASSSSASVALNPSHQPPDVRWSAASTKGSSSKSRSSRGESGKSGSGKSGHGPKLTHVDVHVSSGGERTGNSAGATTAPSLTEQKHREYLHIRKQVEEKWASSNRNSDKRDRQSRDRKPKAMEERGNEGSSMDTSEGGAVARAEGYMDLNSPRRPRPIKKAITADLKENEIMLKLKERLKHQRALASSSSASGSNDTSLADSSTSSAPPPALPPREPLTGDVATGHPKPRKIAAAHPTPSYRGFSEATSENTAFTRPNTKVVGVKKKGGGAKKPPPLQPKKHDIEAQPTRHTPPPPERPKKVARVVASADKRSSKSGAKTIITTSSWRAGQELVMKELGMAPKSKVKSSAQGEGGQESHRGSGEPSGEEARRNRQPDGAEAAASTGGGGSGRNNRSGDPAMDEVIANARTLSEDARSMLNDLQQENVAKVKSPVRPAVKRKAPKASEPEKQQQPCEKTRHYDPDSVRKFMAKQKAERLKRQQDEKLANQKANEKKQEMMSKLTEHQKKQAIKSAAHGRGVADGERRRRKEDSGIAKLFDSGELDHDDDSTLTGDTEEDSTPQATPREDGEEEPVKLKKRSKEKDMEVDDPQQGLNLTTTLTTGTTPTVVDTSSGTGSKFIEFKGQMLNMDVDSVLSKFSQVVNQRRQQEKVSALTSTNSGAVAGPTNSSEFHIQNSHVFGASRNPPGEENAFAMGTSNSVTRSNEERKQAIKATALTLQSRLAEERRKLEGMDFRDGGQSNPNPDFVSRYDRILGNNNKYSVFTLNLPGSQTVASPETQEQAASRIQAAYRGHNVRQALNWELPSGQTFGQKMKGSSRKNNPQREDEEEDASDLTETSTFSEITATEPSDGANLADVPGNRRSHSSRHHRHVEGAVSHGKPTPATYRPSKQYSWSESKADPYSVMSVFSRQNKYLAAGSRKADMPLTPSTTLPSTSIITTSTTATTTSTANANAAFVASLDLTTLKQPVITSTERVMVGHTSSGQPVIAKARYTRVEATVSERSDNRHANRENDDDNSDISSSQSESIPPAFSKHSYSRQGGVASSLRSNEAGSHHGQAARQMSQQSARSDNAYTLSFESDEEDDHTPTASHKHSTAKKLSMPGYNRQVSDAGVETDVSQMSEDEPRSVRSKLESGAGNRAEAHASQERMGTSSIPAARGQGDGDGRLSPNSLANKFSANLNYLESMEESLRQVVGMERTRAVALAQQESVSLAQVLKARQQEHNEEMRNLQLEAQREAQESTQQLDNLRTRSGGRAAASLLEKEDNRRPDSRSNAHSISRSSGHVPDGKEDLSQSPGNRRIKRSSATTSLASVTKVSSSYRTPRDRSSATPSSVRTAEDSRNNSDSSIQTASDADAHDSRTGSVPEEIAGEEDSYSLSFDESVTDEESFRQVLPSESHRKEVRRQSGEFNTSAHDVSSSHLTQYGDLSSLFAGEDSFNKFTAEMVRQIMREEEYRAQHQAALLSLREKALKEKAKAELAWLQQLKQKPLDKGADDVFPNLDKREKKIRRNLQEQQAEIRRLQEANKMASMERQRLLQQHEEIAKIKQNTQTTLHRLKGTPVNGRLARPSEVHTEDEIDEGSDASENMKDSKSDSEMYRDKSPSRRSKGDKKSMEKQQKLRLDHKYMTAREQKLHERKKQAKELLEWKKRLDAEEEKVYKLEKRAIDAWERKEKEKKKDKEEVAVKKAPKPVTASKRDDSNVISDHMLSSIHDELEGTAAATRSRTVQGSVSEAISTQLSVSKSETAGDKKARSRSAAAEEKVKQRSPGASGSESSIPEEVPADTAEEKHKAHDSSDDTLINSSANDDYADTFEHENSRSLASRKKSPVGKLLPQGNSPLPTPWSRKTGSESESEDSISHTETLSDASDYEVRIRQLSDELRRRRKEVEILKKERSKRQKEKFKAQEEALKKQLDAYNNYIQQLKVEKDVLEHEAQPPKAMVKPQIKQPRVGAQVKTRPGRHGDDAASNSSSFEDMRDGTDSNQTSPSIDGKDLKTSPVDDKAKKKAAVPLMDKISEGSESDKSGTSGKVKAMKKPLEDVSEKTNSSSVQEIIEEASQLDSVVSAKTDSNALKIQTRAPAASDDRSKGKVESGKDDDISYSMDFSDGQSSLAQSHSKIPLSARSQGSVSHGGSAKGRSDGDISEHIDEPSSAKSPSVSSHPKFDFKTGSKTSQEDVRSVAREGLHPPATGIQESDSENESKVNSYHNSAKSEGSSRPSSERSVGSMSYSAEDDEEEEDIVSYGSDKTPTKSPLKSLPPVPGALAISKTEEDISEHISGSLPSISDKQHPHSGSMRQDSQEILDSLLGYEEGENREEDEDDKTPVPTPREMVPYEEEEEENPSLLLTDPLADFHLGDKVLVWGRRSGVLRYKGKVDYSPGIWAGVELDMEEGDSDGFHEGKRYFTCPAGHGVMVHGSDISAGNEKPATNVMTEIGEARSPDESLTTDQDDSNIGDTIDIEKTILPASDASMLHSTPVNSPSLERANRDTEKPTATPVKRDVTQLADSITDSLAVTIVQDSVEAMGKIANKKTPPATLPKPVKKDPNQNSETSNSLEKTVTSPQGKSPSKDNTDRTADGVMKSLLDEAISDMVNIKKRKAKENLHNSHAPSSLLNGDLDLDDKDFGSFFDDDDEGDDNEDKEDEKIKDNDSGLSLDPVQRPGSPVPGDSPTVQDRKDLHADMAELFGEYIDDDLGFEQSTNSGKLPPPYPGSDQTPTPTSDRSMTLPEEIEPVVPHTKEEVTPIISKAVDIFWTNRRYGEPLDNVVPPSDFLTEEDDEDGSDGLMAQSRRSWRHMLFNLTGEIIKDIYKDEDKTDTPVWQKATHKTQKFFKGITAPTTLEGLKPIVQQAVFKLLDLNGTRKSSVVNKWNIRKKKDSVDAVLVQELGEEERGWVDYSNDELNLKMSLADSLFDSLISDTVQTLNGIYQRRQHSQV